MEVFISFLQLSYRIPHRKQEWYKRLSKGNQPTDSLIKLQKFTLMVCFYCILANGLDFLCTWNNELEV